MASSLNQFIYINEGKLVDVDKEYGAQCWDVVELYAEQVLNVPKEPWAITLGPELAAKEAWTVFDSHMQKYFDKIPKGQQQKGDINVYGPHGIYTEGHITIELGHGDVFEQNADPDHSPAHTSERATTYLLGSLRRKETMSASQDKPDETLIRLIYQLGVKSNPTAEDVAFGMKFPTVQAFLRHVAASPEHANFLNQQASTVTKAQVLDYMDKHLT